MQACAFYDMGSMMDNCVDSIRRCLYAGGGTDMMQSPENMRLGTLWSVGVHGLNPSKRDARNDTTMFVCC